MSKDPKHVKFTEHVNAIEEHKMLLEKLHLGNEADLAKAKISLENLGITLEEYLKVLGIP